MGWVAAASGGQSQEPPKDLPAPNARRGTDISASRKAIGPEAILPAESVESG
jgi:hypothetical protein